MRIAHSFVSLGLIASIDILPSVSDFKISIRYFLPVSVDCLTFGFKALCFSYNCHNNIFFPHVSIPSMMSRCNSFSNSRNDFFNCFPFGIGSVSVNRHEYRNFDFPFLSWYLYAYRPSFLCDSPVLSNRPLLSFRLLIIAPF